ncbi:aminotransferase class V-fold PLP-dependent enzyme [candidate division WOR-3 bacterium]|uniref:Aminotransferase class V-fold PLP-dependent enzyme n=1 Tax=candidate division WOR-3 bacterium TaxID=2052148 RepID=A0A9D5K8C5_UNCW3|nr:aminotransferase class V-fold PLP-dependent enzyme [candidate division WOR-3 bacterium]MBD3363954.1 aminotransferase class V-fold PLP-dependent enzyme [candidate division WOR-3 bacterium]
MHKKLFIPGPTEVLPEVLEAQTKPMFGHRMKEASELGTRVIEKLKKVLGTKQNVLYWTASGSLIMEASLRNSVKKGVLNTICGAFSERWYKMAKANGLPCGKIEVEWGKAIKPEMVDAELATGKYDVLCLTHNETSTGVMNPVEEIADMVHEKYPDVFILVDAVSSLTGARIDADKFDVVLTSTQKAVALPPGLSFCTVSDRFYERAATVENRGYYTDFLLMRKYAEERKGQTPSTPALSLLNALDHQLDRILEEGVEARYKRHSEMAAKVREWAGRHFELFPEKGYESETVTVVKNTKGISVADLNSKLAEKGLAIANGYGKQLKEKTFRIAHMGDLKPEDVDEVLGAIDEALGL